MAEEKGGFEVKITQFGGEPIVLDSSIVKSVNFKIDTVDENVKDRSENVVNVVVVTGTITNDSKMQSRDLLAWSLSRKSDEVYRSAEITIRINETDRVRKYTLDKVFCIDYTENFDKDDTNNNLFELKFAQRKDNFDGINVIC